MKIIFEKQNKKEKQLTIADVEVDQFFVCSNGYLCQKANDCFYNTITDDNGILSCESFDCNPDYEIKRILPRVTKIEF